MTPRALKDHGREIIETAKDHLVAALAAAPATGWTAVQWAEAAGVLLDGAKFPAVLTHHVAPVLVGEGRAKVVEEDGGIARYGAAPPPAPVRVEGGLAHATAAPQVWHPTTDEPAVREDDELIHSAPVIASEHGPT